MTLSLLLMLTACKSPWLTLPGEALDGPEDTTENFAFAKQFALLQLEVNPSRPYSVILRCTVIAGELYIDAAKARKWGKHLETDHNVRVKLGERVYHAIAEKISDEQITQHFLKGRTVYRLRPGDGASR